MNTTKQSENRVKWTTTALNHFLPLFRSIGQLRHSKAPQNTYTFVKNTEQDANMLFEWISRLTIEKRSLIRAPADWDCQLFYTEASYIEIGHPSDELEAAFGLIAAVFVQNQSMLTEVTEVELLEAEQDNEIELDPDYL